MQKPLDNQEMISYNNIAGHPYESVFDNSFQGEMQYNMTSGAKDI